MRPLAPAPSPGSGVGPIMISQRVGQALTGPDLSLPYTDGV